MFNILIKKYTISNMDINIGTIRKDDNFFIKGPSPKGDAGFNKQKFEKNNKKRKNRFINKNSENIRINDFDLNIMEEYAYKEIGDESLRLEFEINKLENKISRINEEIRTLESLDSGIVLSDLKNKRDTLCLNLNKLKKEYESMSVSNEISYRLSKILGIFNRGNIFIACSEFILRYILPVFSGKYKYNIMVKDSLTKLNRINSKVDEIVKTKFPYGETEKKYEQLTTFINKANYLQSQIINKKVK